MRCSVFLHSFGIQCSLTQVDLFSTAGMNTVEGVVMLASTNRADVLDQVRLQTYKGVYTLR